MKSDLPKMMHPVMGRPMIEWAVKTAQAVSQVPPVIVVGHKRELIEAHLGDQVRYTVQQELLGTGHAVMQATTLLQGQSDAVMVTYGDMPLLRSETLQKLLDLFTQLHNNEEVGPAIAMLTIEREDAQGFGRVVRNAQGEIQAIVEEVDCTPEQKAIRELNPGIYCFHGAWLWENLSKIPLSAKGEYYLTDMVGIAVSQGRRVVTMSAPLSDVDGINTRIQLANATAVMRQRILERHMLAGVTIVEPATTYIEDEVSIGSDTTIWPGTLLQGVTTIGRHGVIGPHAQIIDCMIGDHCRVVCSVLEQARMDNHSEIGPFGHLRKGAHLGEHVHMGNFGEVKNSYLGPGTKMGHFSYIGDAQVDGSVNIGAGTITCNYDGVRKAKTQIGQGAFIGSDTLLVAPVTIGAGATTGAGAVVTKDVAPGALAYGVPARERQVTPPTQSSDNE
ncbi:MAG: bifunctional UDP-N-acetylglucosamine diphosphorylase/glucosamine-1-phosphate N-acetyltransferase GlmU [Caldilineaceae bacterium]|nr:bifunctional UDP-N-acetylglucosamine diphosphorylase/glucosamine-1-phosphate N-acetyltransferase GlmU [Caldilineaceae bacterium]